MPLVQNLLTFFQPVRSVPPYLILCKVCDHALGKTRRRLLLQLSSTLPSLSTLAFNGLVLSLFVSQFWPGLSFFLNAGPFSFVSSISFAIEILLTFINKVFHILSSVSLPPNLSHISWGLSENDSYC